MGGKFDNEVAEEVKRLQEGDDFQERMVIRPRPVKVSVSSSAQVFQILRAAKNLKNSAHFKNVFISRDRTQDERKVRRAAVIILRNKITEESDKHHYIRNGKVISVSAS